MSDLFDIVKRTQNSFKRQQCGRNIGLCSIRQCCFDIVAGHFTADIINDHKPDIQRCPAAEPVGFLLDWSDDRHVPQTAS